MEVEISFLSLPYAIQTGILEKFTFKQFRQFQPCCKYSKDFCENQKTRIFKKTVRSIHLRRGFIYIDEDDKLSWTAIGKKGDNILLETEKLYIQVVLTDFVAGIIIKAIRTRCAYAESSVACSPNHFLQFSKGLKELTIIFTNMHRNMIYDTRHIMTVYIRNSIYLTIEQMCEIKAKNTVYIHDLNFTQEDLAYFIQLICEKDSYLECCLDLRNSDGCFSPEMMQYAVEQQRGQLLPVDKPNLFTHIWKVPMPNAFVRITRTIAGQVILV